MHKYQTDGTHKTSKIITVILRFLTDSSREAASSECSLLLTVCGEVDVQQGHQTVVSKTSCYQYDYTWLHFYSHCILIASFSNLCIAYFLKKIFTVSSTCSFLFYFPNMLQKWYLEEMTWICFVFLCFVLLLATLPLFQSFYFFFLIAKKPPPQNQEQNDT